MQKKKLLLAITKSSWGGAQRYVYDVAVAMQQEYEVQVVCGENEFTGQNIFLEKLSAVDIKVHKLTSLKRNISLRNEWQSFWQMYQIFKSEQPSIVHLNSSKMAIIGSIAAFLARVPKRVYTVHGFPFLDTSRASWKNGLIQLVTRFGFLFLTDIITISKRELDIVKKWPEAKHKATLIYNGFTPSSYLEKKRALSELLAAAPEAIKKNASTAFVIGSIAELRKNKGTHILLEALRQLQADFLYIHVGTGAELKQLRYLTEKFNLEDRVYFAGFKENAAQYLKAFDVFVLPSIQEGTPYVLLEAAAANVPVVATKVGAVDEIITDGNSGFLVPAHDASSLADALETLITDKALQNTFARDLWRHVQERFSYTQMLEKVKSVYTKIS